VRLRAVSHFRFRLVGKQEVIQMGTKRINTDKSGFSEALLAIASGSRTIGSARNPSDPPHPQ